MPRPEPGSLESSRPGRLHVENRELGTEGGTWAHTLCGHLLPAGFVVEPAGATCCNCLRIVSARKRRGK